MTKYIAIEGKGGSGKTHLSNLLGSELGVKTFHLDDYGNDWKPFVGIPKLIELLDQTSEDVVIFEGVGVFKQEFDRFNAFKIFVNTPEKVRAKRATSRDVPRDDRSAEDWEKIWKIWTESDKHYYSPELQRKANLTVGSVDGEFDLQAIKNAILK